MSSVEDTPMDGGRLPVTGDDVHPFDPRGGVSAGVGMVEQQFEG